MFFLCEMSEFIVLFNNMQCAFDVSDYGLGNCTGSLELGCDCLGHIHYFDATLNNSKGEPVVSFLFFSFFVLLLLLLLLSLLSS